MKTLTLALSAMMLLLAATRMKAANQVGLSSTDDDANYQALRALCKEYTSLKAGPDSAEKQEKAQAIAAQQDKIEQRVAKEERTGNKARGRKPKSPEEAQNKEAKGNVTDPDSRIMKTQKGYVQGLNAQAVRL